MGFFYTPPRLDVSAVLQTIDLFSTRSELAVIHEELPWTDLINGVNADIILDDNKVDLVNYLRSRGQRLYFMADLTDGLSRGQEAPQLRVFGRSITEPEVRHYYRDYVRAVTRKLQPDYIGLAAETNLIRQAAAGHAGKKIRLSDSDKTRPEQRCIPTLGCMRHDNYSVLVVCCVSEAIGPAEERARR
jgi:hypothetical protein